MFFVNIYDKLNDRCWKEEFESYYLFRKRITKLKYSKKLKVISRSNIYE